MSKAGQRQGFGFVYVAGAAAIAPQYAYASRWHSAFTEAYGYRPGRD